MFARVVDLGSVIGNRCTCNNPCGFLLVAFATDCVQIFDQNMNLKLEIWKFWFNGSTFNLTLQCKLLLWRAWILRKRPHVLVQKLEDEHILVLWLNISIMEAHEKRKQMIKKTQKWSKKRKEWKLEIFFLKVVTQILEESVIMTYLSLFYHMFLWLCFLLDVYLHGILVEYSREPMLVYNFILGNRGKRLVSGLGFEKMILYSWHIRTLPHQIPSTFGQVCFHSH